MKNFVVIILMGMMLTFLVVTNTAVVPIHFFSLSLQVALPLVLTFPTGVALLCFSFYHMHQMRKVSIVIRTLENDLQSEQEGVIEVTRRVHELELENRKLKIRLGDESIDEDSL
ncbi:MAG: hypothetical protein WAU28_00660 [Candidatus Moraniibacteriota bacterium]